jgi:hypothetical protein
LILKYTFFLFYLCFLFCFCCWDLRACQTYSTLPFFVLNFRKINKLYRHIKNHFITYHSQLIKELRFILIKIFVNLTLKRSN